MQRVRLRSGLLLELTALELLLAIDAVPGPRDRFKPLGIDFVATRDALAERAFADARQSALDHLKQLAFVVALMEKEFLLIRTGRAISDVLRHIADIGVAAVLLGSRNVVAEFALAIFESLFECV